MEARTLRIPEVAKILQVNVSTAYQYARKGIIPATRVGKHWRVLEEALREWMRPRKPFQPSAVRDLPPGRDPSLRAIGTLPGDGTLSRDIDGQLYGLRNR